jgi:hypothetical protein
LGDVLRANANGFRIAERGTGHDHITIGDGVTEEGGRDHITAKSESLSDDADGTDNKTEIENLMKVWGGVKSGKYRGFPM